MFAELKCKTNYSFLEGASQPDELIERAAELGLSALALNDRNGVYGIPKAYWKAKNLSASNPSSAVKLIVGSEVTLQNHPPLTLLAKDRKGYGLMCRLLTQAHAGKEKGKAFLTLKELERFSQEPSASGLFALAAEPLPHAIQGNYAFLKMCFGERLLFAFSRFKDGHDALRTEQALTLQKTQGIKLVATNDVLVHLKERKKLQDAFTAIRHGVPLTTAGFKLLANGERYLKSPFEMKQLFKDLPQALEETMRVAEACTFSPAELRYRYPSEWIPEPHTAYSYLEELTHQGLKVRYPKGVPEASLKQIRHELALIQSLQYADYFLTIYDIVQFARNQGILCQGRGSAANSVVCYCLGITAIDPVQMNLLFERFISAERNEPPDIDVDFEHERREEVIQYIYQKYGRHRAAMVSAVITYQKRSAFRELAKAFGIEVGTLSAKKVIQNFDALEQSSPIAHCREKIDALAEEMHGFPRHLSIHSGGFTLSADPITEIVPVEPARMENRTIIQWDKYDLDYLGLLKIDILALGMLSALKKTLTHVGLELHQIPHQDPATYAMIQRADTVGTFQVESRAQMNMSGRLLPKNFYDLVIQVAIVRPGPNAGEMVHPYLKRRNGLEKVVYPHPALKEILGRTLGVPLFQEQVMKIAIQLGGFTAGESDQLRRAIGAWRASGSIQKVAEKLYQGLLKNGVSKEYALQILEHLKGFAHYGFPESHAASFALLSYASCYLKCHYPAEFTCALINSEPLGFYATHTLVDDVKRHGVRVLPIDPQHSEWNCTLEEGALRLGLKVVHGLSQKEAQTICAQRPYHSLHDFLVRTQLRSDVLHRLVMADAFACFGLTPRETLWQILSDRARTGAAYSASHSPQSPTQQLDLFAQAEDFCEAPPSSHPFNGLTSLQAMQADYQAYGLSPHAHPMSVIRKFKNLPKTTTRMARNKAHKSFVKTAGLLLVRQRPPTAKGVCFGAIEDEEGFLDLVLFQKDFEKNKDVFLNHSLIMVSGYIERDRNSVSMIVKKVEAIWTEIDIDASNFKQSGSLILS